MKIVLIHGAWHDGSLWEQVAKPLRDAGHDVHTPTLAGNAPPELLAEKIIEAARD